MAEALIIPWGSWDLNGFWHPNVLLKMSPEEQVRRNVEQGYLCNYVPVLIDPATLETLIPWLKSHEDDIARGINDFGELGPVFEALFLEKAQCD